MAAQKIVITGGTGFIGQELVSRLLREAHKITILTRNPAAKTFSQNVNYVKWNPREVSGWPEALTGQDVLINLAGANIAGGYWTATRKRQILESRVQAGNALVAALKKIPNPPHTFLQASGIGYYGRIARRVCGGWRGISRRSCPAVGSGQRERPGATVPGFTNRDCAWARRRLFVPREIAIPAFRRRAFWQRAPVAVLDSFVRFNFGDDFFNASGRACRNF
jgi:hypothetical protein